MHNSHHRGLAFLSSFVVFGGVYVLPVLSVNWRDGFLNVATQAGFFIAGAWAALWLCIYPLSRYIAYYHEEAHAVLLRRAGFDPVITFDYETHPWFGFKCVRQGQWSVTFEEIVQLSPYRYHAIQLAPLVLAVPPGIVAGVLVSSVSEFAAVGVYYGILFGAGPSLPDLNAALTLTMEQPSVGQLRAARQRHGDAEGLEVLN